MSKPRRKAAAAKAQTATANEDDTNKNPREWTSVSNWIKMFSPDQKGPCDQHISIFPGIYNYFEKFETNE